MATWTIAGEAGKTVDETPRSLEALQAEGVQPEFGSLESDRLSWVIWLNKPNSSTLVPDLGQEMTLYRDGVRQFTGNVTGRRLRFAASRQEAVITVEGPWWWLTQLSLSSEVQDQQGTAKDRTQFVFATGSPRTFLQALIARAIELGAPIQAGSLASCSTVPRLSLRNMPISEAISEVMRLVADGVVYFDYSADGYPALSMQRRVAAGTVTITPGVAVVPLIDIKPRLDLEVEQVTVASASRETVDGKRLTTWSEQSAGAVTSGLPKAQIVTTTGPEMDTFLPQDFTDSVVVRSKPVTVGSLVNAELFSELDAGLRAASAGAFVSGPTTVALPGGSTLNIRGPATALVDRDGVPVSGFPYYLVEGEVRDWWAQAGIEYVEARLTVVIRQEVTFNQPDGAPDDPLWYESFGGKTFTLLNGASSKKWWWSTVSIPVTLVKTLWAEQTTLIRPEDYAWVNTPDGLADYLLATQNWLPWEGPVQVDQVDDVPAGHALGFKMNIAGFRPETANMGAMISGYGYSIATGAVTYRLGAPRRHAFRDLANRFRQTGNDNIVYLVESVSGNPGDNPEPDPALEVPVAGEFDLTFGGLQIVFSGDPISFTPLPAGAVIFNEQPLEFSGEILTYN